MRSPRGCRSLFRFKGRAPNRFNWHLRPWTQHKSLGRLREGEGVEREVGVAKTEGRRNNRIICICNTLLGQFLDSKWIWTRNDCNVREARQAGTTGRQEGQEDRLEGSQKFDKFRWTRMRNLLDLARNSWDLMGDWMKQFELSFVCKEMLSLFPDFLYNRIPTFNLILILMHMYMFLRPVNIQSRPIYFIKAFLLLYS